jgi:catalase
VTPPDSTLRWDDEDNRVTTPLGRISIEAIVPEATCDAGTFLPANVTATEDPIFATRSPAYIVSFTRRKQTQ